MGFRHVVRNVYGFEFDAERIQRLLDRYSQTWHEVEAEVRKFIQWLFALADRMEN